MFVYRLPAGKPRAGLLSFMIDVKWLVNQDKKLPDIVVKRTPQVIGVFDVSLESGTLPPSNMAADVVPSLISPNGPFSSDMKIGDIQGGSDGNLEEQDVSDSLKM